MQYIRVILKDYSVIKTDSEHMQWDDDSESYEIQNPIQVQGPLLKTFTSGIELVKETKKQEPEACKLKEFLLRIPKSSILAITQSSDRLSDSSDSKINQIKK